MPKKGKYADLEDIFGNDDSDVAVAPRKRRPSPALGVMKGELQPASVIENLKTEKKLAQKHLAEAEQALIETQQAFEQEKSQLLEQLNHSQPQGSSVSYVMPVSGQKVEFHLHELDPKLIDVSPENERIQDYLDEVSLRDILPSIEEHGQQKAGTVRPKGDGRFELIEGSRRLAAVKHLGRPYLALVGDIPDEDVRQLSIIENKHLDVSPYEKAKAYERRISSGEFSNWTQLGSALGISSSHIARYKACVELEDVFVRVLASPSDMPLSYAETIARLLKTNGSAVRAKAQELLERRLTCLSGGQPMGLQEILKELKQSLKKAVDKPSSRKPVLYGGKQGMTLKHSVSRRTGSHKFELEGVPEDKLETIRQYLLKTLGLDRLD